MSRVIRMCYFGQKMRAVVRWHGHRFTLPATPCLESTTSQWIQSSTVECLTFQLNRDLKRHDSCNTMRPSKSQLPDSWTFCMKCVKTHPHLFASLATQKNYLPVHKCSAHPLFGHQKQRRCWCKAGRLGMDSWFGEKSISAPRPSLWVPGWTGKVQRPHPGAAAIAVTGKVWEGLGRSGRLCLLELRRRT